MQHHPTEEVHVLTAFLSLIVSHAPDSTAAAADSNRRHFAAHAAAVIAHASSTSASVSAEARAAFVSVLNERLAKHFHGHWHELTPARGSAYRSIAVVNGKPDRILTEAAEAAGIPSLSLLFPLNITFWIDPGCVAYRIGDSGPSSTLWTDDSTLSTPSASPTPSLSYLASPKLSASSLPPSPPHLTRQQLRQLKIQQKQIELQEMARQLSHQYPSSFSCPTSPPSLSRQKSVSSVTGSSYDSRNSSSSSLPPSPSPSPSIPSPPQARRSKSNHSNSQAYKKTEQPPQPAPQMHTIPGLPPTPSGGVKMSRGGSNGRRGHKSPKYYYGPAISSSVTAAVC